MKFFNIFFFVCLALAMLVGVEAKIPVKAIMKGGKVIKGGLGALGAAGTAHEVYDRIKHRG